MSTENATKINKLLQSQPHGTVLLSSWLTRHGYNHDLQARYKKSKWLESIGQGALIRAGDQVGYEGAVYAMQYQTGASIHPGGRTALSLLGRMHYLELSVNKLTLFGSREEKLPAWFQKYNWGAKVAYHSSSFIPPGTGMVEIEHQNFKLKVSGAARAIMECLYLAPKGQDLLECYELMEGMNNLVPGHVQQLLEQCTSVKVKRLFLYMAEKAGHDWVEFLNTEKVNLGTGNRSLVKEGAYVAKYQITVPKELERK